MTKKKYQCYSPELKGHALRPASDDGVTDIKVREIMTSILRLSIVVIVVGCLVACETNEPTQTTSVNRVLMAPNIKNAPYSRLLVVGATPRRETSRMIEEGLIKELASMKVEAHSFVRESPSTEATEDAIFELVNEKNIDGVIVVSAKFEGIEITTRDERVDLEAEVRGGGLMDYFRYDYKEITQPSYSEYAVDVFLVSDFYDVESQNRIYSVESSTAHGETTYQVVIDESKAIVARLRKDRLIR